MTSPRGACEPATGPWARIVPVELVPAAAVEGVETSQESPTADSAGSPGPGSFPLRWVRLQRIARLLFNCGPTPFKVMRVVEVGTDLVVVVVVVVGKPPASEGLPRPPTPKSATNPRISTAAAIPSRLRDLRTIHILSPHRPATKTAKWHATSTRPPSPGPASRPRTSTLEPARSHGGDDERSRRGEGRVLPDRSGRVNTPPMGARKPHCCEIGHQIADQSKELKVRLPRNLADQAVAIWRRSGSEEELSPETDGRCAP